MQDVSIEVVPPQGDADTVVIRLPGVWTLQGLAKVRIEPAAPRPPGSAGAGWLGSDAIPQRTRMGARGLELLVGAALMDGARVPAGTEVVVSVPAVGRRAKLQWPDAPKIEPDESADEATAPKSDASDRRRADEIAARAAAQRAEIEHLVAEIEAAERARTAAAAAPPPVVSPAPASAVATPAVTAPPVTAPAIAAPAGAGQPSLQLASLQLPELPLLARRSAIAPASATASAVAAQPQASSAPPTNTTASPEPTLPSADGEQQDAAAAEPPPPARAAPADVPTSAPGEPQPRATPPEIPSSSPQSSQLASILLPDLSDPDQLVAAECAAPRKTPAVSTAALPASLLPLPLAGATHLADPDVQSAAGSASQVDDALVPPPPPLPPSADAAPRDTAPTDLPVALPPPPPVAGSLPLMLSGRDQARQHASSRSAARWGFAAGFAVAGLLAGIGWFAADSATGRRVAALATSPAADTAADDRLLALISLMSPASAAEPGSAPAASLDEALTAADRSLAGDGAPRDPVAAKTALLQALSLAANDPRLTWAMTRLGALYATPADGAPDYVRARLLWEMAAARGDAVAFCFLARLHEHGLGTAKDDVLALANYRRARAKGGCRDVDRAISRLGARKEQVQ